MKKRVFVWLASLFVVCSAGWVGDARAGIPVIDVANLAQAIEQVMAWGRQYQQMVQEYEQMVRQYESMTGTRNLGQILNNPELRGVVPAEISQVYSAVQVGGMAGLTAAARSIRNAALIYDCSERTGEDQRTCQALLNQNAQTQAYARNALETVSGRVNQIEALMTRINSTDDPKSIAELQARLQGEVAQVANDQNRLAVLREIAASERTAAQQLLRERTLRNLAIDDDGSALMAGWRPGDH